LLYSPGANNKFVPGEDSYKLYTGKWWNNSLNDKPLVLYTYSSDGFPLEVNTFGDMNTSIKLGIRTSLTGEIVLDFSGITNLPCRDVTLQDLTTGTTVDLTKKPVYTFNKETDNAELNNRFLLTFSGATGLDNIQQGNVIVIFSEGHRLQVISNNSMLKSVQVFDLQGKLLQGTSPQSQAFSTTIDRQGIYVIKAQSETGNEVKKIVIGNKITK